MLGWSLFRFQGLRFVILWGISSAGRAPALHAGGQRFDPAILHHFEITQMLFNLPMLKVNKFNTILQDLLKL